MEHLNVGKLQKELRELRWEINQNKMHVDILKNENSQINPRLKRLDLILQEKDNQFQKLVDTTKKQQDVILQLILQLKDAEDQLDIIWLEKGVDPIVRKEIKFIPF